MMHAVTDASGRFEFPRVLPGPVSVRVDLGPWEDASYRSGPSVPLDLRPGQQAELDLGGAGATVKGKVTLAGRVPADLDCNYSLNYLIRREPGIAPPPAVAKLGFDVRKGWQSAWHKSQEGRAYLSTLQHWFVKLAPDGAFRISGIPPGEYDLTVEVFAKPTGCLIDPLAKKIVTVTVTAEDAAHGELSLPQIAVPVVPTPAIGDTPTLNFQRADGSSGALADFRSHYTVVLFWASWCGACKQHAPALRQQQERFAARGLTMLGLSLDDDPSAWQAALKSLDLPWQQGRLAATAAGVSSVPAYWLLDPAGKIVAKVNDLDELAAAVDKSVKAKSLSHSGGTP
jgi:peroxiredoxin